MWIKVVFYKNFHLNGNHLRFIYFIHFMFRGSRNGLEYLTPTDDICSAFITP